MPNGFKALTLSFCGAALLLSLAPNARATAQSEEAAIDLAYETLDFSANSEVKVNGTVIPAVSASKPADLYADVVKVIPGAEDSYILYLSPTEARKVREDGSVEVIPVSAEPRPFVAGDDWTMFDASGQLTTDPRFAVRVILPYRTGVGASLETSWNECQGPISGNYTGLACSSARGMSNDYLKYLQANYIPCVNEALKAVKLDPAVSVHLMHDGTLADERHSSGSLHSAGRAIDVLVVTTTDAAGKKYSFDFRKTNTDHRLSHSCKPAGTQNCEFFEKFRACWGQLQVARKCPARQEGDPIGTMGWEDARHIAHHLHTSYPFCPNSNGYFITQKKTGHGK